MAELPTTSFVILGLLSAQDWSAYELAEVVGRGLSDLWPRADRQRYNAPKKLVDLGLIEATQEMHGRRPRTVYSITPAGRDALEVWLAEVARPPALEFEGMVRVLVADEGTIEDLRANLRAMAEQARAARSVYVMYAEYITATGGTFPRRRHLFALSNKFMIGHFTHILDWAEWALAEIEEWPDTSSPVDTWGARADEILAESGRWRIEPAK